jgi:hypothetical protein
MQRKKRIETISQLRKDGFRVVKGYPSTYVNNCGKVYDLRKGKFIKPTKKNYIKPENQYLNVAKLVIQTFGNDPYRSGQITYIDGDKENLNIQNIKYSRLFVPNQTNKPICHDNLISAIRCYFEIEKGFSVNNRFMTRLYLQQIAARRFFFIYKMDMPHIEIFRAYLYGTGADKTAKGHNVSTRDYPTIINHFTGLLVSEILQDLKVGILEIHGFRKPRPTKTQIIKDYNKKLAEFGCKLIPLRKKSTKELLKGFKKHLSGAKEKSKNNLSNGTKTD